jgi:hypothetical protein
MKQQAAQAILYHPLLLQDMAEVQPQGTVRLQQAAALSAMVEVMEVEEIMLLAEQDPEEGVLVVMAVTDLMAQPLIQAVHQERTDLVQVAV